MITGGEALYADMGHFGRRPIRLAWFAVVLPALLLNYFGQGALLLTDPDGVDEPVLRAGAAVVRSIPLVVLATAAAVIASQALISGAFSLTQQAVQLGYCPRVTIVHTSHERGRPDLHPRGQLALWIGCICARARLPELDQHSRRRTASRSPAR